MNNPAEHQDAPAPLGRDEVGAIVILLVAAAGLGNWVPDLSPGRVVLRVLWVLIYLAACARLVQRCGEEWLTWTVRHQPLLCGLLALALASTVWSLAPLLTMQKAISLIGTTVLGIYIGYILSPRLVMRVMGWSFAILILSSLAAILLLPASIVADAKTGYWRGIMGHKNAFGAVSTTALLFFLVMSVRSGTYSVWAAAMCALCLLALTLSHSATAIVALVVGVIALACFAVAGRAHLSPRTALLLVLLILVPAGMAAAYAIGPFTRALGRDVTLTGRTDLWADALQIIHGRPLTGYGYSAVWKSRSKTRLRHIKGTRYAANAHNDFLNVATELGVPAALLLACYLLSTLRNAVRFEEHRASRFSLFLVAVWFALATMTITESQLLHIHSFFWIWFVAMAVMLERACADQSRPDR